jgi:hypothetical protein
LLKPLIQNGDLRMLFLLPGTEKYYRMVYLINTMDAS